MSLFAIAVPAFLLPLLAFLLSHAIPLLLGLLVSGGTWLAVREYQIKNKTLRHEALVLTAVLEKGAEDVAREADGTISLADLEAKVLAAGSKWLLTGQAFEDFRAEQAKTDEELMADLKATLQSSPEIMKKIVQAPSGRNVVSVVRS